VGLIPDDETLQERAGHVIPTDLSPPPRIVPYSLRILLVEITVIISLLLTLIAWYPSCGSESSVVFLSGVQ